MAEPLLSVAVVGEAALHTTDAPLLPVAINAPGLSVPTLPVAEAVSVTLSLSPEVSRLRLALRVEVTLTLAAAGFKASKIAPHF